MARKKARKTNRNSNQNYILSAIAIIAVVALIFSVVGMFKGEEALAGEAKRFNMGEGDLGEPIAETQKSVKSSLTKSGSQVRVNKAPLYCKFNQKYMYCFQKGDEEPECIWYTGYIAGGYGPKYNVCDHIDCKIGDFQYETKPSKHDSDRYGLSKSDFVKYYEVCVPQCSDTDGKDKGVKGYTFGRKSKDDGGFYSMSFKVDQCQPVEYAYGEWIPRVSEYYCKDGYLEEMEFDWSTIAPWMVDNKGVPCPNGESCELGRCGDVKCTFLGADENDNHCMHDYGSVTPMTVVKDPNYCQWGVAGKNICETNRCWAGKLQKDYDNYKTYYQKIEDGDTKHYYSVCTFTS